MEKTLPFRLPEQLKRDLELTCAAEDRTAAQVLRQLVRGFIDDSFDKRCAHMSLRLEDPSSAVTRDLRTGGSICPNEPEDVHTLKRIYFLLDAFERLHPEVAIMPYAEREDIKQRGRELQARGHAAGDLAAQLEGYGQVMRAHFARSAEASLDPASPYSYLDHPGYDEFARHYVAWDARQGDQPQLLRALQARWPAPAGALRVQGSYWRPKTNQEAV